MCRNKKSRVLGREVVLVTVFNTRGRRFGDCCSGRGDGDRRWGTMTACRGVAQPGRALGSGPRGRRFKSSRPDHFFPQILGELLPHEFPYFPMNPCCDGGIRKDFLSLCPCHDLKMDEGCPMIQLDHRWVDVAPMLCLKIRVETQV